MRGSLVPRYKGSWSIVLDLGGPETIRQISSGGVSVPGAGSPSVIGRKSTEQNRRD